MYRWHAEHNLMLRRWRQELATHNEARHCSLAPPSLAPAVDCHCAQGIGSMRKRRPFGCTKARCFLCHAEKFLPKGRAAKKRAAIEFELRA
jgi:hypothetical protein